MDENAKKTDSELLALAAVGNEVAFSELVGRYQGKVFGLAYRYVRDRQDAEELAQEIFFKVWKYARTFQGRSAFATWLYRLAVNSCLNFKQREKVRPVSLPLADSLETGGSQAVDDLVAVERESRLRSAMASLPARQRLALALANFSDKSYEEIAALMEVSLPAVESLIFRARKNLAAALRPLREKGEL